MASAACWDTQDGESCDTHVTKNFCISPVLSVVGVTCRILLHGGSD